MSLCAVASPAYQDYADQLMESAREWFWPSLEREFHIIPGEEGWPNGTMMRYHRLLEHWPDTDYVFLSDADMRFDDRVGPEILPEKGGITATLHPGYVETVPEELPFERNTDSVCHVKEGSHYFCGGFVGGAAPMFHLLAKRIALLIDFDAKRNIVPVFHDESALNFALSTHAPEIKLTPSYCFPDNDSYYRTIWKEDYPRKLTALDKAPHERIGR